MIKEKDLDNLEDLLVDEVKNFTKKGSLQNPTEAQSLKDILEGIKIIHCIRNGGMNEEDEGYSGYSGYSGGWGRSKMPHMPMDLNTGYPGYSGRRSATTGRYISSNGSGYSGHSIRDRMIDSLEQLYDQAGTQHEKTELDAWINKLRTT